MYCKDIARIPKILPKYCQDIVNILDIAKIMLIYCQILSRYCQDIVTRYLQYIFKILPRYYRDTARICEKKGKKDFLMKNVDICQKYPYIKFFKTNTLPKWYRTLY